MSSTSNTLFVQYNVLLSSFNAPPAPPPPNYETRGKCTYMPNPLSLFQILFHGDQTGPAETGECLAPGCMPNCQPNGGKGTIINDATIILQIIIPSRISFQLSFITLHPWASAGTFSGGIGRMLKGPPLIPQTYISRSNLTKSEICNIGFIYYMFDNV